MAQFDFDDLMAQFDFDDLFKSPAEKAMAVEEWAEVQLANRPKLAGGKGDRDPAYFDIETGPRPEEELRPLFHEKTEAEFADGCDKRWKPETVAAKYVEYKAKAWQEFVERAALSPVTGRVLLIGTLDGDTLSSFMADDEATILDAFWSVVDLYIDNKRPLIGHNSNSFDLPFLVRRSWALGVPVPREVRQGRYWNPLFLDTMEWWQCGQREYVSLNALGAYFGVGQKTEGVGGGDFAKLWFGTPEERKLAIEYNAQDLRLTAAIAAKMGMV